MKNFKKGFTLIELLIVIALLGALAVGLLAALDPFEQLKKGTDTGVRNTVSEVQGAIVRYYAIKNQMPWCTTTAPCVLRDGVAEPSGVTLATLPNTLAEVIATGELKADFATLAGAGTLSKITITGNDTNATVAVCFKPLAKSFIADNNTKFTIDGQDTCGAVDATHATCYWCVN